MPSIRVICLFFLALASSLPGAQAGESPLAECANKKDPRSLGEQYCQAYQSTPLILADIEAGEARDRCRDFYTKAAEGLNTLCDYRAKAAFFRHAFLHLPATKAGQSESTPEFRNLARQAAATALEAASTAARLQRELVQLHQEFTTALDSLAKTGRARMQAEYTCTLNGDEGRSPGAFLEGIALWQARDEKATFENVAQALRNMRIMASAAAGSRQGSLGHPEQIPARDLPAGDAGNFTPDCAASADLRGIREQSVPQTAAITAIGGVLVTNERFASIAPALKGGYAVKVAYDLIVHHEFPVHATVISGIAMAASLGFGPEFYVPTSTSLTALDATVQNRLKERKIRFLNYMRTRMTDDLSITSEQLGRAWKGLPENEGTCYPNLPGFE